MSGYCEGSYGPAVAGSTKHGNKRVTAACPHCGRRVAFVTAHALPTKPRVLGRHDFKLTPLESPLDPRTPIAGRCNVCGDDTRRDPDRCTNGRCGACHRACCTPGGQTAPGHGFGSDAAIQRQRAYKAQAGR